MSLTTSCSAPAATRRRTARASGGCCPSRSGWITGLGSTRRTSSTGSTSARRAGSSRGWASDLSNAPRVDLCLSSTLRRGSSLPASVTAPVIAAVVTEDRRGYHDGGQRRRAVGVTGTRNGNGDASGGSDSNQSCKNYRHSEALQSRPHSLYLHAVGREGGGVYLWLISAQPWYQGRMSSLLAGRE